MDSVSVFPVEDDGRDGVVSPVEDGGSGGGVCPVVEA